MNPDPDPDAFPAYIPVDPRSPDPDFRPGAVWTQARADYLAGESAPRVCQRYDLALSTFRTRMRMEGWRRCDQQDDPTEPRELGPAPPTPELVDQAWRAMADALKRGRAYEARTFLRLVHDLRAEVSREEALMQHAAWKTANVATSDPALHDLHSESHSAAQPSAPFSAHPRAGGDPAEAGAAANPDRSPEQVNPLVPRLRGDERDGCEPPREQGTSTRTATPDPALHCLHAGLRSAGSSADVDALEADLAEVRGEADRLQALARTGKATKAELVTLHTLRTTLRHHRTACDALRAADRAMAGA